MSPTDALVPVTIDGVQISVEPGTLIVRAAEQAGIAIPRFCDHPQLKPVGACRQCLVDVSSPGPDGKQRAFPKPQAACTMPVVPGMVVQTAATSPNAAAAQTAVMELLLTNHPLDCPTCDKAGECPLQNQAMAVGRDASRYTCAKRTYPKPIALTAEILLDRERCILCQRCTRFADQIAADPFIALQSRGARQQVGRFDPAAWLGRPDGAAGRVSEDAVTAELAPIVDTQHAPAVPGSNSLATAELPPISDQADTAEPPGMALALDGRPFASYFSGNLIQLCPVGALTSASYRFQARPFDLVSTESVAEHDSSACDVRIDVRRGQVRRRLAAGGPDGPSREWLTDKDRFAFAWQSLPERLTSPLVRHNGELRPASWPEAIAAAAAGLTSANSTGVLPGGRLTFEDALAYSVFARAVLATSDVDFRARPHSAEEAAFLNRFVAGTGTGVTLDDLAAASHVILVGFEPEEEGGIVYLRLREAAKAGARIEAIAPYASPGIRRLGAHLIQVLPGTEAAALTKLLDDAAPLPGTLILLGERLALAPGALAAAAHQQGGRLAWIPRRVGERAGVEAGLLPGPLPPHLASALTSAFGDALSGAPSGAAAQDPTTPDPATSDPTGRDTSAMLAAAAAGQLDALVVGGVEVDDLPDPTLARTALDRAFTVSLEILPSQATALADVVLPVAPPAEKSGTYITWEGRPKPFGRVLTSTAMPDSKVLQAIATAMDRPIDLTPATASTVLEAIQSADAAASPTASAPLDIPDLAERGNTEQVQPVAGQALLATWHLNLDAGRLQAGDPHLAGTAKAPFAVLSRATAFEVDVRDGERLTVSTEAGAITVPVRIGEIPDRVVWLPTNSSGCQVRATLGVSGGIVQIEPTPTDRREVVA
ncbi:MAG: NADH-quinone oxidoreductase subunit G [Bifidobacteriaceae bacterium]|jgi:NADH-quinone oxidoreductase subunit G|nr:NADH-quinone oxidoreductase subunit G [Bifidobacteriaceae bacterium]